ncbi:plant cadmium resistance 2 [Zostera marina]|uniref:Plant cadmium resistance 2 n=1 Tax=Zostera marina TaxID=29655 RepID=A0A0K9Q0I2_ZOSMR|nr:plant cadmium resistance 2 [Zostera marina]
MEKISDHIQQEVNQPQPASGYPVYNVSAPPLQPQSPEWSTGLFDCCDDPGNSFITFFCPCITFGQISEIVDKGTTSCCVNGTFYALLYLFCTYQLCFCQCVYSCVYRGKLRAQYSLEGSSYVDFLTHLFCECCALSQEYRELKNRGFNMELGWLGNMEKMGNGVQQVPPPVQGGMNR